VGKTDGPLTGQVSKKGKRGGGGRRLSPPQERILFARVRRVGGKKSGQKRGEASCVGREEENKGKKTLTAKKAPLSFGEGGKRTKKKNPPPSEGGERNSTKRKEKRQTPYWARWEEGGGKKKR